MFLSREIRDVLLMAWMFLVVARSSGEERGELRKSPDLGVLIIFHIERALLFFFFRIQVFGESLPHPTPFSEFF